MTEYAAPSADRPAAADGARTVVHSASATGAWWADAVIYQVYPRSFADANGDGMGDLAGITSRLPYLRDLGVDAVWISPFYPSPQADAGYDVADYRDVDPLFGSLDDADTLIARAHELGLRVIVDLVPNHTSDEHEWFQRALAADAGSPERDWYLFRDADPADPARLPNNWPSEFGGPAWSKTDDGQWYLHLFDSKQPDLNWSNPAVREAFEDTLRFWLDRGVDGFRVDVAHGLVKAEGLPSSPLSREELQAEDVATHVAPYWDQDGVHDVYRSWRAILDSYPGDRAMVAEAWVRPQERLAAYVRPDEHHQAFNFGFLDARWNAAALRESIIDSYRANDAVGAPTTWVLSNHDVIRHVTRLSLSEDEFVVQLGSAVTPAPYETGLRRARAATAVMLALPGSAYLYQGEELGLPEVLELDPGVRQDPTYRRTDGERLGRDGCRVPIPWKRSALTFGFGDAPAAWLPQPTLFGELAVDQQAGVSGSTLELYRSLLALRRARGLGGGSLAFVPGEELGGRDGVGTDVFAFDVVGGGLSGRGASTTDGEWLVDGAWPGAGGVATRVVVNFGAEPWPVPTGFEVNVSSEPGVADVVPTDCAVWLTRTDAEA